MMSLVTISTLAAVADQGAWTLPTMVMLPLLAAIAVALAPVIRSETLRQISLGVTLLVFVISMLAAWNFDWHNTAAMQLRGVPQPWMGDLGLSLTYGIDSVSLWLILLTTFLFPVTILGTWQDVTARTREFYVWLLALEGALIGVFTTTNLIVFYIFFELTLIPLFFLIGIFGSGNRQYAALKFFIFTLAGSVFTFAGVVYVAYYHSVVKGEWTFEIPRLMEVARQMSSTQQGWVLLSLMAGFAIKVPLFPVHTWLPLAHTEAPTAGSVILAGVLLKLGTYGLLRFAIPFVPQAVVAYAPVIAVLSIIGIIYAALICWVQSDIKKLVAYSSVSHMGFCVLGMFALNTAGVGGSIIYMLNHGLSTGALFLCVGMIYRRFHTRDMDQLRGLGKRMPLWSTFFVFFCFASAGLPGLNGFVGEFLTTFGAYTATNVLGIGYAVAAATGVILGAIYILYMVGKVVMGPVPADDGHGHGHDHHEADDLNGREILALVPLALACLVLGLFPTALLHSLEDPIKELTAEARVVIDNQAKATAQSAAPTLRLSASAEEVTR
jgi:NADH-quinone oxidoreductase subunit M